MFYWISTHFDCLLFVAITRATVNTLYYNNINAAAVRPVVVVDVVGVFVPVNLDHCCHLFFSWLYVWQRRTKLGRVQYYVGHRDRDKSGRCYDI